MIGKHKVFAYLERFLLFYDLTNIKTDCFLFSNNTTKPKNNSYPLSPVYQHFKVYF